MVNHNSHSVVKLPTRKSMEYAFLNAFEMTGGVDRLTRWADDPENYPLFLQMLLKFAPKEQVADIEGKVLQYISNVPESPLNRLSYHPQEVSEAVIIEEGS